MDLLLKDKVVLVTGSSRGIGLATAKAFAAEGCRLMLSARSADALRDAENALRADGATVAGEVADVTQPDDAARLVQAAVTAFDGIDILVNNVGGGGGGRAIADSTDEDWRTTLEINLLQTVRMMRLALPHMSGRAGAAVINVSSISGWSPQLVGSGRVRRGQGSAHLRRRTLGSGIRAARHTGEHGLPRLDPGAGQWLGSLSPRQPGELR